MATNFPTSLDSLTNPTATSTLSSPSHSAQHADANDAIEALEAKVGVNNSAVTTSLDYRVSNPELVGGAARPLLTGGAYIDGTNGLVLSGLSGNYASTLDSAALSITGDIDIKVKLTLPDWTPSSSTFVVSKWSGAERSYYFQVTNSGQLRLSVSADGSGTSINGISTVATGLSDGATKWVRGTMDADDGSGNRLYKFYLSDDGTTWSQLGTTVTTAGTTSIYDSTSNLEIGSFNAGTAYDQTIGRVIIQSAFDTADNTTSLQFDADFAAEAADTLAFTEDSANAATVSVTTTRYTVGIPGAQLSTTGLVTFGASSDRYQFFEVTRSIDVDMYAFEVTSGPASAATVYMAMYEADDDYQPTGTPIGTASVAVGSGATGVFYAQITPVTLTPGKYVVGFNSSVQMQYRGLRTGISAVPHTLGANPFWYEVRRSRTAGTFPSSPLPWNTTNATSAPLFNVVLLRWKAA